MSNKIKIAHEAPLFLMPEVRLQTDYDYALVHLFEDPDKTFAEKYLEFFRESLQMGRKVILDNSVFELDEAFNMENFFNWVYELQPTEYIIPDVLESCSGTLGNVSKWENLVSNKAKQGQVLKSKAIAVVQGSCKDDCWKCFKQLQEDPFIEKIAISFDYSWYLSDHCTYFRETGVDADLFEKEEIFSVARQRFVEEICNWKENWERKPFKPLHLLGCFLPQEFKKYKENLYIDTIDTSNPVVHGLVGKRYSELGLKKKEMTKLVAFMKQKDFDLHTCCSIFYNIQKFRSWVR